MRDTDRAVARALGWTAAHAPYDRSGAHEQTHWFNPQGESHDVPHYSTDIAAMYDVEEELLRRGLARQYAYALIHVVMASYTDGDWPDFLVLHATPEQRAAAAIEVMEEGKT